MTKAGSGHRRLLALSRIGLAFLVLCGVTTAAHGASQTIAVGGTGGGPFKIRCPQRHVLIAFSMRTGKALDAIAPVCKPVKADGTLPPNTNVLGRFTGGNGGDHSHVLTCPRNTFVEKLHVFVDRFEIVNHIEIQCRRLQSPDPFGIRRPQFIAGEAKRSFAVDCSTGSLANGIHGNSGALIDRIGLLCDAKSRLVSP